MTKIESTSSLFVYGTLQVPEIVELLLGRIPIMVDATISHWRAAPLAHTVYPGLIPANAQTRGVILHQLSDREIKILDDYEGDEYYKVTLYTQDGTKLPAYAIASTAQVLPGKWDLTEFRRNHLRPYLKSCQQWIAENSQNYTS